MAMQLRICLDSMIKCKILDINHKTSVALCSNNVIYYVV